MLKRGLALLLALVMLASVSVAGAAWSEAGLGILGQVGQPLEHAHLTPFQNQMSKKEPPA